MPKANKQNDERYRLLVQAVEKVEDYAIFMMDNKGFILTWNLGAERIKGYKENEIVGQHFSKFYTEKDLQRNHPQEELKIASEKGKFEEEGWRLRKDGSRFWANVLITRLSDDDENIIGFSKVTRDLTERKEAQEALLASESRFRLMIEGVKDYAIFMLDENGYVATWNQGAQNLKGYLEKEIVGKHFSTFYPVDKDRKVIDHELVIAASKGKFEEEGWRIRKDGSRFWASVLITPIKDSTEKVVGFSKVTRDLTERKEAEDKLKRLNEDLDRRVHQRTKELEKAKRELEASLKYRDEFMSLASHELKTPITSLLLQLDFIRISTEGSEALSPEVMDSLNVMDRQAQALVTLIEDLLDASRIRLGKLLYDFHKADLSSLVEEILDRWEGPLKMEECSLERDIQKEVFSSVDKARFEQVLSNLINNCLKYAPGKPIEISLKKRKDSAELRVKDNGPGIQQKNVNEIFNRFSRGVSHSSIGGLGLGLFISKTIIDEHKGEIYAENDPRGGALFTVTIPLAR